MRETFPWCFYHPDKSEAELNAYITNECIHPARVCYFRFKPQGALYPAICFQHHRDAMIWRLSVTGAIILKSNQFKCEESKCHTYQTNNGE